LSVAALLLLFCQPIGPCFAMSCLHLSAQYLTAPWSVEFIGIGAITAGVDDGILRRQLLVARLSAGFVHLVSVAVWKMAVVRCCCWLEWCSPFIRCHSCVAIHSLPQRCRSVAAALPLFAFAKW